MREEHRDDRGRCGGDHEGHGARGGPWSRRMRGGRHGDWLGRGPHDERGGDEGGRGRHRGRHGPGGRGEGRGRMFDHGALRWVLLDLIREKPSHGYELIKLVEARLGGAYAPSPGVIYPTLTLLEEMGALTSQTEGGKKLYSITEDGMALLAENAEVVAAIQEKMGRFAERSMRPTPIHEAIHRLRDTVRARISSETPLTEAQVAAIAAILNRAADEAGEA